MDLGLDPTRRHRLQIEVRGEALPVGLSGRGIGHGNGPFAVHVPQQVAQRIHGPARLQGLAQQIPERLLQRGPLKEHLPPGAIEEQAGIGLGLVEEAAALQGALLKHPLAETVDGGDGGPLHGRPGLLQAAQGHAIQGPAGSTFRDFRRFGSSGQEPIQEGADAGPQFQGRLLRVGDDEDPLQGHARQHAIRHQVLEGVGLPRTGAGLQHGEGMGDAVQHGRARDAEGGVHGVSPPRQARRKSPRRRSARASQSAAAGRAAASGTGPQRLENRGSG